MRAPVIAILAVLAAATPVAAETVRGGTLVPGESVAGLELLTTRADTRDMFGRPREQGQLYMSFGPSNSADVSFDVYFTQSDPQRVRMIGFWGPRFVLDDGTKLFGRRARPIPALKRRFGDRLRRHHLRRTDTRLYRVRGRFQGERVWTDFIVDRFGRRARVLSVFLLLPDR